MEKLRVLLIETNRLLRKGITSLLNEQGDITAMASTGNRDALVKAREFAPHVVLLDLGFKIQRSQRILNSIRNHLPHAEVVVLDLFPAHSTIVNYAKAGVAGYVPRNASLDEFLDTIRSVGKGVKVLPLTMQDSLMKLIVEDAIRTSHVQEAREAIKLTEREFQVARQLASGKSVNATATELAVASFSVKGHLRNIIDKLAIHTHLELFQSPSPAK